MITCSSPMNPYMTDSTQCTYTVVDSLLDPMFTDNCKEGERSHNYTHAPQTNTLRGAEFPVGTTEVIWTVTDASGNTATCMIAIEVIDTEAPVVSNCPLSGEIIQETDNDRCDAIVNFSPISYTENCGGSGGNTIEYMLSGGITRDWTEGQASGIRYPMDTTHVSYRATDTSGNVSIICEFDIIIVDSQNPDAICRDVTLYIDSMGVVGMTADSIDGGSYDNCGIDTIMASQLAFTCSDIGDNNVVLTVIDSFGNIDSCVSEVTVLDTIIPVFECPVDMTVSGCSGTVPDLISGLTGEDNCGEVRFSQDPIAGVTFGPDQNDTVVVVITAVDHSGNEATCDVVLEIIDDENPHFQNCPDSIVVCNDAGICGAVVNWIAPVAFDNCDDSLEVTQTMGLRSGTEFPVGTTIIEYTAEDNVGNTITCMFPVIVKDCEAPVTLCKDVDVVVSEDCDVAIYPKDVDAGSRDNCGIDTMLISIDGVSYVDSIVLTQENLDPSMTTIWLQVRDSSGNISYCTADIEVFDVDNPMVICQEDITVSTEPDVCYGLIPNILPPLDTSDNCTELPIIDQFPEAGLLFGSKPGDSLEIFVYVEDTDGNRDTCSMFVHLEDNQAPNFENCPRPVITVKAMPGMCGAFVNFSLPEAEDNCTEVEVIQIDDTGLTSGDMFPVGAVVLEWVAFDPSGNYSDTCRMKVIVNDEQQPELSCPKDLTVGTDAGECLATVDNITATVSDNCEDNMVVQYHIENVGMNYEVSGFEDASGEEFKCGENVVTYRVQDESLVLISEVTHELEALNGGTDPVPSYISSQNPVGDDYIEVTNFGPAHMNMSCVQIERVHLNGNDTFAVPLNDTLEVGEVMTVHFGQGDANDTTNHYYHVPGAMDLSQNAPALYIMSIEGRIIDVVAVNGANVNGSGTIVMAETSDFTSNIPNLSGYGGAIRDDAWDTNDAEDFILADVCMPTSIGSLNSNYTTMRPSGVVHGFQNLAVVAEECSFTITVEDTEAPSCGMMEELSYTGSGSEDIVSGEILMSQVTVSANYIVGEVKIENLDVSHANAGDLTFKLESPSGTQVILIDERCKGSADVLIGLADTVGTAVGLAPCGPLGNGGMYIPEEALSAFIGENSMGTWTLKVANGGTESGTLNGWKLVVSSQESYAQGDTTLENESGLCGATFEWTHPTIIDNCIIGNIIVEYSTVDSIDVPEGGEVEPGYPGSEFFGVGTTTVTYTIFDKMGNTGTCSFEVTVEDVESPEIECPFDQVVNLDPGACSKILYFWPLTAKDNCSVDSIWSVPPSGYDFPIGETEVTIYGQDPSGNVDSCSYTVTVEEYEPSSPGDITCNDTLNVSLDENCSAIITADMLLEGNDYGCYDDYCIELYDSNGVKLDTLKLTLAHAGQTIEARIIDCEGGGAWCSTYLRIEDKLYPKFECPVDTFVYCNEASFPDITGEPHVTSCEDTTIISYVDKVNYGDFCDDPRAIIERTWTVSDGFGNASSCVQTITVTRFNPADVDFPEDYDDQENPSLSCVAYANDNSLIDPVNTGVPMINGTPIMTPNTLCPMTVTYVDEWEKICEGTYDVLRKWRVYDPCRDQEFGVNPFHYYQRIRIVDDAAPEIECPAEITLSTSARSCFADFDPSELDIEVNDVCSETVKVEIRGNINASVIPIGTHVYTVIATDACGNEGRCELKVTVVDDIPPTPICDQETKIAIGADGTARLHWTTIEDGSYDNCEIVENCLLRMDVSEGGKYCNGVKNDCKDYVYFCCEDVGKTIQVLYRVTDGAGNVNTCMVNVTIEDKLKPVVVTPPNVTISCEYDYDVDNLSVYFGKVVRKGEVRDSVLTDDPGRDECLAPGGYTGPTFWGLDGYAGDNCEYTIEELTPLVNLDKCGEGTITRRWSVEDESGSKSVGSQTISVEACDVFTEDDITWPRAELELDACAAGGLDPEALNSKPTYEDGFCGIIAEGYEDEVYTVVEDACFKIKRTWTIIDWCRYNKETGEGSWTFVQYIKVTDMGAISILIEDFTHEDTTAGCTSYVELLPELDSSCSLEEYFDWRYTVDLDNDGTIEREGYARDASGNFPYGTHRVTWKADNGCGNVAEKSILLTVTDGQAPTAVCYNGISVEVMPSSGEIELGAEYFNRGSFDNCTLRGDLRISYSSDVNDTLTKWTCVDLAGLDVMRIEVELWATDAAGNQAYCVTYLELQDNDEVCPNGATGLVSGLIETEEGSGVNESEVILQTPNSPTPSVTRTDVVGSYEMLASMDNSYVLSANNNSDLLNGVTAYDLTLIQRHILGITELTSPYKLIAADINRDGQISGKDLTELRRVILGIDVDFRNNASWQMVDAKASLTPAVVPIDYVQEIAIAHMSTSMQGQDFIGVKIGDVNGTVDATGGLSETRTGVVASLEVEEAAYGVGEEVRVAVRAGETMTMDAYQFTLDFGSSLYYEGVESGVLAVESGNIGSQSLGAGMLSTAWYTDNAVEVSEGEVLFTFVFRAAAGGTLSEALTLSSELTRALAYVNGEERGVELRVGGTSISGEEFALEQNEPNPFSGTTIIGYVLPEAGEAVLTIRDVQGRVVYVEEQAGVAGMNQVEVTRDELGAAGVLYYTLESGDYTATKKMVVID